MLSGYRQSFCTKQNDACAVVTGEVSGVIYESRLVLTFQTLRNVTKQNDACAIANGEVVTR